MRCPPSASAVRSPAFSLRSSSCDSTSALIARSSRSKSLDFEAALEMKRSPVVLRSYRGPMEYVKRLSNKEAAESDKPEGGEERRSNCVAISQTHSGIVRAEALTSSRSRSG
jgi:hypothetical protein